MPNMLSYSLIDELHAGVLAMPEYLTQVEKRYKKLEPQIHAFVLRKDRSKRLLADEEKLMDRFPNPSEQLRLFGALVGMIRSGSVKRASVKNQLLGA